jgi:hypothetical protein
MSLNHPPASQLGTQPGYPSVKDGVDPLNPQIADTEESLSAKNTLKADQEAYEAKILSARTEFDQIDKAPQVGQK